MTHDSDTIDGLPPLPCGVPLWTGIAPPPAEADEPILLAVAPCETCAALTADRDDLLQTAMGLRQSIRAASLFLATGRVEDAKRILMEAGWPARTPEASCDR